MKAELDEIILPVVFRCKDCRYAQDTHLGGWLECWCPRQDNWADRAANDDFSMAESMRQWHCHGDWWEGRLPAKPRGLRRLLCWLRKEAR